MIIERATRYYSKCDLNCAESILRAANDEYGLGLDDNAIKTVSGFGGGIGCGSLCGAVAGGVAAIGVKYVDERMHNSPDAKSCCIRFFEAFKSQFGSTMCEDIRPTYAETPDRCLDVVRQAAEILDCVFKEPANHAE